MFGGFGMGAGGWVLMMVFWVVLVAVIVWAIARVVSSRTDDVREARRAADSRARPQSRHRRSSIDGSLAARSMSRPTRSCARS